MKTLFVIAMLFAASAQAQTWKPNPKYVKDTTGSHKTKSVQCYGTTKQAKRCKMHGQPNAGDKYYCRYHIEQK